MRLYEDVPGDQRLVAYYLARSAQSAEALQTQLSRTLPAYMVPSNFVHMEAFPLTTMGKVDIAALPAPGADDESQEAQVTFRTESERQLARIWQDLLRGGAVGLDRNFFSVGGHSCCWSSWRPVFEISSR